MESRPVFADPSGRRHRALRLAGFGSMAVLAVFLVAVVMAVTGGPQAPFTQWAAPQAPSGGRHGGDQALTGGSAKSGTPRAASGSGGSSRASTPGGSSTTPPARPASPSPSAGATPSPTASPPPTTTVAPTTSPTHGHGHGKPHSSASATPTA